MIEFYHFYQFFYNNFIENIHNEKNRSELEIQIRSTLIQFEKEFMGRGPIDIKTYLFDDIVFIRLKEVLTKAETKLASGGSKNNRDLIKRVRIELLEFFKTKVLVGQIRTRLGIPGQEMNGPQTAAAALIE
ncbi:MAG: DUF2294 family protein [Candidatus Atribacteria bacterium]|nr:DUF2294 family protein [Candidatus Atribacteria bacterium]